MAKRLNNLLRGQSDGTTSHSTRPPKNGNQVAGYAALRAHSTPRLPYSVCLRRSLRRALHLDLLATVLQWLYANWRRFWQTIRQLSGDDAYERYLAHHTACHADTTPLSRKKFFQHEQQQKWSDIKRCC